MSREVTRQSWKARERHTIPCGRVADRVAAALRKRALILLLCCLIAQFATVSFVRGQSQPRPAQPSRIPTADNTTTAPQHSSPDADYALSSLASRTVTPNDTNDADLEVNNILAHRLWQNRISAPDPDEDADVRAALRDLISKVQSVSFDGTTPEPTFTPPTETPVEPPSRIIESVAQTNSEPAPPLTAPTAPTEPAAALSADTLQQLDGLVQNPDQVNDPLEMAELLFLSGRVAEAAVFYEKALAQIPANDLSTREDRAWVLFQLANCLRETDLGRARDTYMKLISQHPSSPWTELAKAHGRLITWYQSARPDQLMPRGE